ncbi:MAG: hypothetical protein K1X57_10135 [Gemmataceae bacterium]|nr:hypothetical protein [Gemmataceae bacterium]
MKYLRALSALVLVVSLLGTAGATNPPSCSNCAKLPTGAWYASPWTTPNVPACQPLFASGLPLDPEPPLPITVVRLQPIPMGVPKDPPKYRPITDEPVMPPRRRIDIDFPPVPDDPRTGPRPPINPNLGSARLHLLLLVDNEAKEVGATNAAGADLLLQLFRSGIRNERIGSVTRLGSDDLKPENIAKKIAELSAKPEDTVVAYYAGPAEYDEGSMGFVLKPAGARLARDELKKQLLARGARLTVLLTDPAVRPVTLEPATRPETPDPGTGGLERLFFNSRGVVDVHGCSVGEFAAARGSRGGCFTLAFVREFGRPAGTWADLLESVKFSTNNLYKTFRLEVLKNDDVPAPAKAIFRNQESQVPAPLTPVDNIKPVEGGTQLPPAPLPGDRQPARIMVLVPEGAQLWVDGQLTTQQGRERSFETTPLAVDRPHVYEVRMVVQDWAGLYHVAVTGGRTTQVELQIPTPVAAAR